MWHFPLYTPAMYGAWDGHKVGEILVGAGYPDAPKAKLNPRFALDQQPDPGRRSPGGV